MGVNNIGSFPVPTMPSGGVAGDQMKKSSGTNYDVEWVSPATFPTTIYVSTTGNDSTGNGSSGSPYATLVKALSRIPDIVKQEYIISVADGTYSQAIQIGDKLTTGSGRIKIQGNAANPDNVIFSGANGSFTFQGNSLSPLALIRRASVELEGIKLTGTGSHGIAALNRSNLILDRVKVTGTTTTGVTIQNSDVELQGDITISGWSSVGFQLGNTAYGNYTVAGTLTLTGPVGVGLYGFHVVSSSAFAIYTASTNITITNVTKGFEVGLVSQFSHQGALSTITVDNVTTPASSSGVLVTDCSSWSTDQTVVIDHVTNAFEANSISYIEATSTRTITNVSSTSVPGQNSVIYLP